MGFLETLKVSIIDSIGDLVGSFINRLDEIFLAALVVFIGYVLGVMLGHGLSHILKKMKFDQKFKALHIAKPLEKVGVSGLFGWVVKWYTFIVFATAGANIVKLYPLTEIVYKFAEWFPKLLLAMAIGILGAMGAEYIHHMILHLKTAEASILANVAKYFVLVIVIVLALQQVIDIRALENTLLVLVGGVALGIAIAIGLAFGLAFKEEASGIIARMKQQ